MKWAVYFIMLVLAFSMVSASYISITTNVKSEVVNDTLHIYVNTSNHGDEAAHNVQIWAEANAEKKSSKVIDQLGIAKGTDAEFEFDVTGKNKGRYPIVIRVDYADANLYPFSALTHSFYYIEENVNPDVFASLEKLELSDKGKLILSIRNLGDNEKTLMITLALPKELLSFDTQKTVIISPKSQRELGFEVERFSALSGSNYVVYAIVEYDEDNTHYTTFAQNFVSIAEKKALFGLSYYVLIPIIAALVIAFIILQFRKKK